MPRTHSTVMSLQKKMGFVSIWFAFAFALYMLNRYHKRTTFTSIPYIAAKWKILVLMLVGFAGGILTAVTGSGLDICTFRFYSSSLFIFTVLCSITSLLRNFNSLPTECIVILNIFIDGYFRILLSDERM